MVVVAIVAILASIGIPAYREYVRRSQLQEAFAVLSDYGVKMEQYFQDEKNYGNANGTACATASIADAWSSFSPTGAKFFSYSCETSDSGQAYVVTATGIEDLTTGYVYTINQSGERKTTMAGGSAVSLDCWKSSGSC